MTIVSGHLFRVFLDFSQNRSANLLLGKWNVKLKNPKKSVDGHVFEKIGIEQYKGKRIKIPQHWRRISVCIGNNVNQKMNQADNESIVSVRRNAQ